jgi:hypothetical protein
MDNKGVYGGMQSAEYRVQNGAKVEGPSSKVVIAVAFNFAL